MTHKKRRVLGFVLSIMMMTIVVEPVCATTVSDLQNKIEQNQNALNDIYSQMDSIESEQEILEEEIADINAEMINLMTSIELLEDNIATKEADIAVTQAEYEEAVAREEKQYEEMLVRMKFMYEQGDGNLLTMLLGATSFADMINKADYIEQIYVYDRKQLQTYQETAALVAETKEKLENEKASLMVDKLAMEDQQSELDSILAKKRREVSNYEAMLRDAEAQAKEYKALIKKEQQELSKLQAGNTTANNGNYTVTKFDTSIIDKASGSATGKNIAKYGCQFIGNPYVYGGTSLTNGADCSGFIYRIYADFGYSLPRTSKAMRTVGTEVSYENAQPGDIICYEGHVALYCGSGYIVHASTPKTGIKIGNAKYKTILTVRRVVS